MSTSLTVESLTPFLERCVEGLTGVRSVEQLSGGASQETYKVEVDTSAGTLRLALRRAPRGENPDHTAEHPGLAVEAALLQAAHAAGVPEPKVLGLLQPAEQLGQGILMEWLEGEALGARIVRSPTYDAIRPSLAASCGTILAKIHAIDLDAPADNPTGDPATLRSQLGQLSPLQSVNATYDIYLGLSSPQPMIDFTARWLVENLPEDPDLALVHNDFRNGNLLIDAEGITAVLDWELAHVGDPMRDLGWLCVNSWRFGKRELPVGGFGQREELYAAYETQSGTPVDVERVRFWEVFGSFWWAVHSLGMGFVAEGETAISVERPAIARRSSECQIDCVNLIFGEPEAAATSDSPARDSVVSTGSVDTVGSLELPTIEQLLGSVEEFLRSEVAKSEKNDIDKRTRFLSVVAANSLGIVARDAAIGPASRREEAKRLRQLLDVAEDTSVDIGALRAELSRKLRSGLALDTDGLADHLRHSVRDQVRIDQPRYSGLKPHN